MTVLPNPRGVTDMTHRGSDYGHNVRMKAAYLDSIEGIPKQCILRTEDRFYPQMWVASHGRRRGRSPLVL